MADQNITSNQDEDEYIESDAELLEYKPLTSAKQPDPRPCGEDFIKIERLPSTPAKETVKREKRVKFEDDEAMEKEYVVVEKYDQSSSGGLVRVDEDVWMQEGLPKEKADEGKKGEESKVMGNVMGEGKGGSKWFEGCR